MRIFFDTKELINKEKKNISYIFTTITICIAFFLFLVFSKKETDFTSIDILGTLLRVFNSIIGFLAYLSTLILYKRTKNKRFSSLSMFYLILFIDVFIGNIDFSTFYSPQISITDYITVSTSIIRMIILVISVIQCKTLINFIDKNKIYISLVLIVSPKFCKKKPCPLCGGEEFCVN